MVIEDVSFRDSTSMKFLRVPRKPTSFVVYDVSGGLLLRLGHPPGGVRSPLTACASFLGQLIGFSGSSPTSCFQAIDGQRKRNQEQG